MNSNLGVQTAATIAWDGAASFPADLRRYSQFAWSFEVTAAIAVDAVFTIEAADPSVGDDCVPGAFAPVAAMATCHGASVAGNATVTLPAGSAIGSVCSGTIPCKPGAFIRLVSTSGDTASVKAVLQRNGPMV